MNTHSNSVLPRPELDAQLSIRQLSLWYGPVQALHHVTLSVPAGAVVALLGSNGAGKSSLLNAISGHLPRARATGVIAFAGRALNGKDPAANARMGIAHVPEGRRIFAQLTVEENLRLGGSVVPRSRRAAIADIFNLFPALTGKRHDRAGFLSGGQQQMLAIGRGLMSSPTLLLLDEPSLGLSPLMAAEVGELIVQINATGTTVLLVEQNARMALNVATHAYVLELGRVVFAGSPTDPTIMHEIQSAYLGGRAHSGAVAVAAARPRLSRWAGR